VIRQDERFAAIPVLFLTGRTEPDMLQRVFAAGGDDFVPKPVIPADLLARVQARLERTEQLKLQAETDALTGLATRVHGERVLARWLGEAVRDDHALSVALLNVDRTADVNARWGRAAGDAALRELAIRLQQRFGDALIARWGGDEFVVAHRGGRVQSIDRLAELLDDLQCDPIRTREGARITLSFTAGVAAFPQDGRTIDAVQAAAERALSEARRSGRGRVSALGMASQDDAAIDVLVVEDDPVISSLLVHALEARGYRTRALAHGDVAAAALLGEPRTLRPRLVLLDVDLPGIDGLSLLRKLRTAGALKHMRVIMLTVRASEEEVVKSLELDAFDHIAKPFSTPVLMQRVRRALAEAAS
jgi:diguanylate cyclase (GGDEF)-like protein